MIPGKHVPGALDGPVVLALEDAVGGARTLRRHNVAVVEHFHFQYLRLRQLECVVVSDNLDFVWHSMSAYLSLLK